MAEISQISELAGVKISPVATLSYSAKCEGEREGWSTHLAPCALIGRHQMAGARGCG